MEQTRHNRNREHGRSRDRAAAAGTRRAMAAGTRRAMVAGLAVALGAVPWAAGRAQTGAGAGPVPVPVVSRPVIQQAPGRGSAVLGSALARLGRNPSDIEALIDAGNAALNAGDTDAAVGFFTRADRLSPNNPRIVAGLAGAKTVADDAPGALALFEAIPAGTVIAPDRIADHGLAADLVGDNAGAQTLYLQALAAGAGDEARRRLGISLAIAGDARGSGAALSPLLQKQDRAAWRTRAFALAILGQEEDAVAIAKAIMPADLAMGMAPYLRYMRRLTRAQQASAANLGHFPLPSAIGSDDARVVAWQQAHGLTRLAAGDARAMAAPVAGVAPPDRAAGAPEAATATRGGGRLAAAERAGGIDPGAAGRRVAAGAGEEPPPEPQPSVETRAAVAATPGLAGTLPVSVAAAGGSPALPAGASVSQPVVQRAGAGIAAAPVAAAGTSAAGPVRRPSFAEAFAAFAGAPASAALPAGAVDVRSLGAAPVRRPASEAGAATGTPAEAGDARPRRGASVSPAAEAGGGAHRAAVADAGDAGAVSARHRRGAGDGSGVAAGDATSAGGVAGGGRSAQRPGGTAADSGEDTAGTARAGHRRAATAVAGDAGGDGRDSRRAGGAESTAGEDTAGTARAGHRRAAVASSGDAGGDARAGRRKDSADSAAAGDDDSGSARHRRGTPPPAPAHPARIWVQVGIGRSDERVAYDWKRMAADDPKLFKGRTPAVSAWGRTRRVLIGPFDSEDAAAAYAARAKTAGHGDAFVWHSPAGQPVDPVATGAATD